MLNNGQVKTEVVQETKLSTLKPIIEAMVKGGSIVSTDEWLGSGSHAKTFRHEDLNYNADEFVRNGCYTNRIEGLLSFLKRCIYGIYHSVSPQQLKKYISEFDYGYNTRLVIDAQSFRHILARLDGKLTYKQLKAKASNE